MFKVNFDEFKRALEKVDILPDAKNATFLNYIILEGTDGKIRVRKTGVETEVQAYLDGETDGEIISIPSEICNLIQKIKKGNTVEIHKDKIIIDKKEIGNECFEDVPKSKDAGFQKIFEVPASELKELLSCSYACRKDETRPILQGVCIDKNYFVALDGYRMAVREGNFENFVTIIVPNDIIKIINKFTNKNNDIVEVYINEHNYSKFKIGDTVVIGRNIDGEFIKWQDILPKEFVTNIRLNKNEIKNILEILELCLSANKDKTPVVILDIREDRIIFENRSGIKFKDEIENVDMQGNSLRIGFNVKYFIETLKQYKDDEIIEVGLNTNVSPMQLKAGNKTEILLPVRIIED